MGGGLATVEGVGGGAGPELSPQGTGVERQQPSTPYPQPESPCGLC